MTTEPTRVLLAAGFPPDYIRETIVPKLEDMGISATVVPVDYKGDIKDVEAVLFMFQWCSHPKHDAFKARCKAVGVKFILLTRQASEWPRAFKTANLNYPGHSVNPKPFPTAALPAKPSIIVGNGMPLIPPPAKEETAKRMPFSEAFLAERKATATTQDAIAEMCEVSTACVRKWELGFPVAQGNYDTLVSVFPKLAEAEKPTIARRIKRPEKKTNGHAYTKAAVEKLITVLDVMTEKAERAPALPAPAPASKSNGHRTAPPLQSLLRAARALGVTGALTVTVDDGETIVKVGVDEWPARDPDAAVEVARSALDAQLSDMLRRLSDARTALAGAS